MKTGIKTEIKTDLKKKKILFINRIHDKLTENRGESLAEVLISTLIISMAMILLAGMVMAARNLIEKSDKQYKLDMNEANAIEAESGGDGVTAADETKDIVIGPVTGNTTNLYMQSAGNRKADISFQYNFLNKSFTKSVQVHKVNGKSYTYKAAD